MIRLITDCYSAYKPTCPQNVSSDCSSSNKCTECYDELCIYCQNTLFFGYICNSDDCMLCINGYKVNVLYADNTGECVIIPTVDPTFDPTLEPTFDVTFDLTTNSPTFDPTAHPTTVPTNNPTAIPIYYPTYHLSYNPITFGPTTPQHGRVIDTTEHNTEILNTGNKYTANSTFPIRIIIVSSIIGCVLCVAMLIAIIIKRNKQSRKRSQTAIEDHLKSVVNLSTEGHENNNKSIQMIVSCTANDTSSEKLYDDNIWTNKCDDEDAEQMYVNTNTNHNIITTNGNKDRCSLVMNNMCQTQTPNDELTTGEI